MTDQLSSELASLKLNRDEPRPRSGWMRAMRWVLGLGGVSGASVAFYLFALPQVEARFFKPEVQATEIFQVNATQASLKLTSSGYVVAQNSSEVGPVFAGRVSRIEVKEGDRVEKGQVLAVLDSADRQAAVAAAGADVSTAVAKAQVARAELKALEIKAKRERFLAKEGVSAAANADDLDAQVAALKKQVSAAQSSIRAAQAAAKNSKVSLDYMTVTAPMDGLVVGKPAGVGAMVGPFVGPICKLVDLSSIVVETDVPEARLHMLKVKGPAEIVLDAFPNRRLRGEITQIGPRVDRAKATISIKVRFVDATDDILPDMAARVHFTNDKLDKAAMNEPPKLVVPASAVTERAGSKVVFVLDGGRVRMRAVTVGKPLATGFELGEGAPAAGTRVVKDPPPELVDGREVKEATGQ